MRAFLFKAASRASVIRWEEMKGRTTRCKEADISAVQNCKWIGEPVRTSTAICMWATRKSQRVHFFPPSGYIHLFYTFASERWCCLFSAIYSIMIISRQEKFAFKPKRIIKIKVSGIFIVKFLKCTLTAVKYSLVVVTKETT